MDRDELAIIEAANRQGVNVHKNADGNYEVGLTTSIDPVTPGNPRTVDTFIGGGMITLESGRTLKRTLTPDEARREFGLA
jgi:hypothetical protein